MSVSASQLVLSLGHRTVLDHVDIQIDRGEVVAIRGASGSGKTTLLRVLAGLQLPDYGSVHFEDRDVTDMSQAERSGLRLRRFGFVFQFGDLVPELSIEENIALPLEFLGVKRAARRERVNELIQAVGLGQCRAQLPHTVSGGERQRAAVARALVHRPKVIFADEPTGSLDTTSRDGVLRLLLTEAKESGCSLVVVTHDAEVARRCDRIVELQDGRIEASAGYVRA